jgi:hypothetical protein
VRAVWLGGACALAAAACTSGVEEAAPPQGLPRAAPGRYAEYPEKIASFGAAVLDGGLYVYSGHIGETHEHSIDNLSTSFRRLDLRSEGAAW